MPPQKFSATQKLQRAYEQGIRKIVARILPPTSKEQTLEEWMAELAARSQATDVREASEMLAHRMVHWTNVRNARTWREAAAKSQQSRQLYNLLQNEMRGHTGVAVRKLILENAHYIRSIPMDAAKLLTGEVLSAQQAGARAGTISKMMRQRFPRLLTSRVHLISRTETQKASTALTQARCDELDIDWYRWVTSKDQRVRKAHREMQGVLVPWGQAPSPEALVGERSTLGEYHAGSCPNCRCYPAPILTLNDITFPARVYWNGAVHMMTKQQFKQIATRLESRAA